MATNIHICTHIEGPQSELDCRQIVCLAVIEIGGESGHLDARRDGHGRCKGGCCHRHHRQHGDCTRKRVSQFHAGNFRRALCRARPDAAKVGCGFMDGATSC